MDAEFRLYDVMIAICKHYQKAGAPLPTCYAKMTTLANKTNRSTEQVRSMLRELEKAGWVENLHPGKRRGKRGRWESVDYRVLEHEDFLKAHPDSCPPNRYDPETDELIRPGKVPPALGRTNVRRMLGPAGTQDALPEVLVEVVRQAMAERTATGNPVPVTTTGNPVPVEITATGSPVDTATGNPALPPQEILATATGNPVTSLRGEPDIQPANPSLGGLEEWSQKNLATIGVCNADTKQWLNQLVEKHSEPIVVQALQKYLHRPSGFNGVKNPWGLFKTESDKWITGAMDDAEAAAARAKLAADTEVLVRQQMREHHTFMNYEAPKPNEGNPEEYFD